MMVYQIGKTKVFLRAGQMAELDARRAEVLGNAARIIQRQIRTHIARKEFIELRRAAICLQSTLRGILIPYFYQICLLCFLLLICLVVHYHNCMFGLTKFLEQKCFFFPSFKISLGKILIVICLECKMKPIQTYT